MFNITLLVTRILSTIRHKFFTGKGYPQQNYKSMRKNKFSILLSIMSFCLISCQPLKAQTSFHRILNNISENSLQSASVLLKPIHATSGKSIFSDISDYADKSSSIENFHFPTSRIRNLNPVLHLSASSFKNEKFVTTGFSLPGKVTQWWKLKLNVNYDWAVMEANSNTMFQIRISDYNINATQTFKLSKDFYLKLTWLYSSIGFLPSY